MTQEEIDRRTADVASDLLAELGPVIARHLDKSGEFPDGIMIGLATLCAGLIRALPADLQADRVGFFKAAFENELKRP